MPKKWIETGAHYWYMENDEAQIAMMEQRIRKLLKKGYRITVCINIERLEDA